jgi:hypothetical protein
VMASEAFVWCCCSMFFTYTRTSARFPAAASALQTSSGTPGGRASRITLTPLHTSASLALSSHAAYALSESPARTCGDASSGGARLRRW